MATSVGLLVDAIVRQTVVLIAALATGAGQRPSLSHIADCSCVQDDGPLLRAKVHARFAHDDPAMVRAVLRDLVDSGSRKPQ